MSEEYSPSPKEVVYELLRNADDFFSKENLTHLVDKYSTKAKELKPIAKDFIEVIAFMNLGPYALPTAARIVGEFSDTPEPTYDPSSSFLTANFMSGLILDVGQFMWYVDTVYKGHPEVLAIPVATNAISAVYEKVRSTREKLISQHLDSIVND